MEKSDEKDEIEELVQTLEQEITHTGWDGAELCQYGGFWLRVKFLSPTIRFQKYFKAHNTDIILCTNPKCGTTWLKALTFSIANRHLFSIDQNPLLTSNPHQLVQFLEVQIYREQENPDLENIPSPRIFSTHMPYQLLPSTIHDSKCRIIYICRNPLDQFVSRVHFFIENFMEKNAAVSMDKSFDEFCKGIYSYGPSWDHVLGYWDVHLNNTQKVLFLKYEDLKEDIRSNIKKIAEFIELPFTIEEEKQGLVEQIARLCSFDNLKSLEVNIKGNTSNVIKNSSYFRKGEVGDWANYLTPTMVERLKNIFQSKLQGSGLEFNFFLKD